MEDRYSRNTPQGDYYGRREPQDYGQDYASGRPYSYSSARDYAASGYYRDADQGDRGEQGERGDRFGARGPRRESRHGFGPYGERGQSPDRNWRDESPRRHADEYGYDYDERDLMTRAGDEVRSWFGDEEAERRRRLDERYDDRRARAERTAERWDSPYAGDPHYQTWRRQRIAELDRDYDEYRRENEQRFHSEFNSWRNERQGQREGLSRVEEHMEVVGSDGEHVGTVDKVRGDRIILTKSDPDAGGHHHSIPSRWIQSVDDKVTIRKTATQAQALWKDEERGALFGAGREDEARGPRMLGRSFAGTY